MTLGLSLPSRSKETRLVLRAAISSIVATLTDGLVYEALLFASMDHYGTAAFFGAVAGAVTNFALNRQWAFVATDGSIARQALRYVLVSALTFLGLRSALWLLVDVLSLGARIAWVPAKLVAFAAISYPLQRVWVFGGSASDPKTESWRRLAREPERELEP